MINQKSIHPSIGCNRFIPYMGSRGFLLEPILQVASSSQGLNQKCLFFVFLAKHNKNKNGHRLFLPVEAFRQSRYLFFAYQYIFAVSPYLFLGHISVHVVPFLADSVHDVDGSSNCFISMAQSWMMTWCFCRSSLLNKLNKVVVWSLA